MILWSKGLGKLVLNMRLSERSSTEDQGEKLVIDGTMGPPTHWDYAVKMNEEDVLDFVELLKQPAPVRFLVEGERRGALIRTALVSGVVFAWNTIRCFLGMEARGPAPAEEAQGSQTTKNAS
ncbi:MAG: hypothetical protein JRG96_17845 [Deltaproteobacteria bacterium]|nr:hypothetical protein [Deltaproteobacteria bacterium]MBW2421275.1 hypothetical protein [Deltaproteobacteria bacterium]